MYIADSMPKKNENPTKYLSKVNHPQRARALDGGPQLLRAAEHGDRGLWHRQEAEDDEYDERLLERSRPNGKMGKEHGGR